MAKESEPDAEREHWNNRYSSRGGGSGKHSAFLERYAHILPRHGTALDIACGTGENVFFLAKDLQVTGIDLSDVAIGIAAKAVDRAGLRERVQLVTAEAGAFLNAEGPGKYALVASINFFDPAIVPAMKLVLAPGGTVVIQAFTTRDERLRASPRMQGKLVTEATLFEPAMLGGYWIQVNELENFMDDEGLKRERINLIARKPH
jgi:tellurite methyltransferase